MIQGVDTEEISDGIGGVFVLKIYPRRVDIRHVNEHGRDHSIGRADGTICRQLARLWVDAMIERLRSLRDRGRWLTYEEIEVGSSAT